MKKPKDHALAEFVAKVTKMVDKAEQGNDPLHQYRITGMNKLTSVEPMKLAAMTELLRRARS
jgi:hypothetical protein